MKKDNVYRNAVVLNRDSSCDLPEFLDYFAPPLCFYPHILILYILLWKAKKNSLTEDLEQN